MPPFGCKILGQICKGNLVIILGMRGDLTFAVNTCLWVDFIDQLLLFVKQCIFGVADERNRAEGGERRPSEEGRDPKAFSRGAPLFHADDQRQ